MTEPNFPAAEPNRSLPDVTDDLGDLFEALPEVGESFLTSTGEVTLGRIYLALVQQAAPDRQALLAAGFRPGVIDAALTILQRRRFLEVSASGSITLAPPEAALRDHALRLERQAATTMSMTREVSRLFYAARAGESTGSDSRMRLLDTVDDVHAATAELVGSTTSELVTLRAPTLRVFGLSRQSRESQTTASRNADGKTLKMRTVYDLRLLQIPNAREILESLRPVESQRFTSQLPFSLVVGDARCAVIDTSFPGRSGPVGLYLESPPLAEPVQWLAESFWDAAMPVSHSTQRQEIDEQENLILRWLSSGVSDSAIARQVDLSQRTVERRIKGLMDRLGAQSRFQMGLLARERGWL